MESSPNNFASLAALRARHEELLSSASKDESLGAIATSDIQDFLSRAAATGTIIIDPRERRAVQNNLRFWAAELITRGVTDWALPVLAPPQLASAESGAATAPDEKSSDQELAHSRALVRIAASARQWRVSNDPGWLLKGAALEEAEQFVHDDDDIRALVDASR